MINICYVDVDVNKNVAAFTFPNIDSSMIKHILTVKSWTFTTWNNNSEMINYVQAKKDQNGFTVVETKYGIGFVPIFIKHLNGLGFILLNSDKTQFDLYEYCKEVNFPMLKYQLRDYQYSCSLKWDRDKLGVIKSPTGSGKTVMGCYIIKSSGYKTLILVHTIDLINVWKESLLRAFGNSFNNRIGIFGSGKLVEKALDVYNNVIIGTYQSAKQEKNLNALKKAGFGLIINDECIPADVLIRTTRGTLPLSNIIKIKNYNDTMAIYYYDIKINKTGFADFDILDSGLQVVYSIYLIDNEYNSQIINCTTNHKFLTYNRGENKYEYKELKDCTNIMYKANKGIKPYNVLFVEYRSTEQCYNITVHNENHNYLLNGFVSKNCHHVPADTFKGVLNALMIPYKLGLSATPRRLDGREGDIFALVDSVKASVSIHELVRNKYVVKPEFYNIYWNDTNIVQKVANSNKNGLQKSLMLKKMSSTSHIKINLLIKLLKTFEKNNESFLLFADFVDATIAIESIIQKYVTKYNENFVVTRVSQDMKSDERSAIFKQVGKKYQGIIFAKLGSEGIDISAVDNVIIMSPSKSPTTFAQRTGRAMRIAPGKNKCKIFQFVLNNSNEKNWSEFSFDEYRNEGFVQKNCILR